MAFVGIDPFEVDAPAVDGGQGQDGRGQEQAAGDVEREVEAVSEGAVGGGDHLVDDVGDGRALGRGRLGLALVGAGGDGGDDQRLVGLRDADGGELAAPG